MKWPDELIQRVKDSVDLRDLIDPNGQGRRSGDAVMMCCPFHDEKNPSFAVYRDRYHCYSGACGESGDAIRWLLQKEGMTFPQAVRHLASMGSIDLPEDSATPEKVDHRLNAIRDALLLARENRASAMEYLASRNINEETCDLYECGFVDEDGFRALLDKYSMQILEDAGLIRRPRGNVVNIFRNRIMFPIYRNSTPVGFSGRLIGDGNGPKYLNSPETELFKKRSLLFGGRQAIRDIRRSGIALVIEGYMDVLTLAQNNVRNAVSVMGTTISDAQYNHLIRAGAQEIVFCLDGDAAGRKAALTIASKALAWLQEGQKVSFMQLPQGSDPDELMGSHGIAVWQFIFEQRESLSQLLTRHLSEDESPEGRSRAFINAQHYLGLIEHAPVYRRSLAARWQAYFGQSPEHASAEA